MCDVTRYLHVAHVFDKHACSELEDRQRRGLVSLASLGDYENAIYLCPADHAAFDARDPGLVVVPTYLDFFLEHERRWQNAMKSAPTPIARSAVLPTTYADHCAERTGTTTNGLYTAYPMVDYKIKDTVEPPTTFQWHGDPGATIWKAHKLLAADLSEMSRAAHMRELKEVRKKLGELRNLREEGDSEWTQMMIAQATSDGPRSGPSGSSHGNGGDSHGSGQPPARTVPPPASSSGPAGADGQCYPSPITFTSLAGAPVYDTHNPMRKRAFSDVLETSEDAVRVDSPHKRIKSVWMGPSQRHPRPTQTQKSRRTHVQKAKPTQQSPEPCRWGGPTRSTEETVRYWNAIFGRGEGAVSAVKSSIPEPP